jgi:hypothetical protein
MTNGLSKSPVFQRDKHFADDLRPAMEYRCVLEIKDVIRGTGSFPYCTLGGSFRG